MPENCDHTKFKNFPISRVHCTFNQGVNSAHCKGASELVLLAASAKIYCSEVEIIRHKHGKKGLSTVQGFFFSQLLELILSFSVATMHSTLLLVPFVDWILGVLFLGFTTSTVFLELGWSCSYLSFVLVVF